MIRSHEWGTAQIWNLSLESGEEREPKARDYLWATDLGKSAIDVFLEMRGVAKTNPPNGRAKRKFSRGHYMEWLVSLVYMQAGILRSQQERIEHQYPGLLRVSGKSDFLIGGMFDFEEWEKTEAILRSLPFPPPEFIFRAGSFLRQELSRLYPEGLGEQYVEVKSTATIGFNSMEAKGWKGRASHRKQLFHYLKGGNRPFGKILYLDSENLRLEEVDIANPGPVEDEYHASIAELTAFYEAGKDIPMESFIETNIEEGIEFKKYHWKEGLPPLEPMLVFNRDEGRFSKNFNVEYSNFLTMLYGFDQPADYDERYGSLVGRWNRVLGRIKKGDKMTPKNLEIIEEIKKNGFDMDAIIADFADVAEEEAAE